MPRHLTGQAVRHRREVGLCRLDGDARLPVAALLVMRASLQAGEVALRSGGKAQHRCLGERLARNASTAGSERDWLRTSR
jgi:hypothetical protein